MSTQNSTQPAAGGRCREPVRFRGSIYYRDAMERARTLIAMSTFCREWDTSLHFIGTQSDCDQTRADVAELDKDTALAVRFTAALPQSGCPATDRKRRSQTIRTAMNDAIALDPEAIVWVELPLGTDSTLGTYAPTLRSHKACIQNLTAANAPILFAAYRFDGLSDAAARTLMSSSDLVTSAPFAVAFCRDYLNTLQASSVGDVPADLEFLTPPGGTSLRRLMRSENMVTLGQMAAGIAHELGNPLAIISSGLQYLQGKHKGDDDSPDGEFTRMALESVDRMDGMLRTMRDFAASKQNPAIDVDLNTVISEVLTFTAPECRRRGVRFTMLADSTLPPVSMDIIGLKGIVLNLIKNALDAMRERGDTLTVRTRWYPDSSSASVEVENNGPPIPDEVLPNLFRPYYTTKTEGTGLGLYLSKQIAGAHGGDVLGQNIAGSVLFTLVLPAVQTSAGKEWHA